MGGVYVESTKVREVGLVEERYHPFGNGVATVDGIQWSSEVATTDGEWTEVESVTINPPDGGEIVEVTVGVTWAQKSGGATKYVRGRVQAKNVNDGTWTVIMADASANAYVEDAADASSYAEHTVSGVIELTSGDFDAVPFEVKVEVQREDATEEATGKVKSSSYIDVKWVAKVYNRGL